MIEILETKHNFEQPIVIGSQTVYPGENALAKMNVGRLSSDTPIDIVAQVYRSKNPGPCVLLLGGVHGDEINGVEIIRKAIEQGFLDVLDKGTVIAIPLLNVFGFINFSREVPDGKDVNRSFPGSSLGSLASRVANTVTKKILPYVDVALDFHTGGASRYNFPQVRYTSTDKVAEELAIVFGARFAIRKALIPKSFRKTAKEQGISTVVFEGGESVRLDGFSISKGLQGMKRVFAHLDMLHLDTMNNDIQTLVCKRTTWVRAPYSGIFIWSKQSGQQVRKGEPLGMLKDPYGSKSISVNSKHTGWIVGHNNASVVNQGDALFHVAIEYEQA